MNTAASILALMMVLAPLTTTECEQTIEGLKSEAINWMACCLVAERELRDIDRRKEVLVEAPAAEPAKSGIHIELNALNVTGMVVVIAGAVAAGYALRLGIEELTK